eukprot:CAMPEP_0198299822 /NCGR_PEP_ID=MMETSP1449-20131203/45930_1 /TAXON_ID=420275 /ORGANISM="Attheya septentrionalis, Strain CCMP2084" /LENGTH=127 /DNA_ID=CAMNT_0044001477 /DNA_START=105 /DNA_END=488 /DNA_ORIENTATION=+
MSSMVSSRQTPLAQSFCFSKAPKQIRRLSDRRKFIMFSRVLFEILETNKNHDIQTLEKAKTVLRDCAKRQSSALSGPAADMKKPVLRVMETRLREAVGEIYWHEAEENLNTSLLNRTAASKNSRIDA